MSTFVFTQTGMSVTTGYQWLPVHATFQYLNREETHRYETHPAVERVEIWDRACGIQIVRVQNCDESHHNAWDGQCMEYRVEQLHIDAATAAAHAVQQYR